MGVVFARFATYLLQIREASRNAAEFVDYYNSTMNPERSLVANLAKTTPIGPFVQAAWDSLSEAIKRNVLDAGFIPKVFLGSVAEHNGIMMALLTYGMPMSYRWDPETKVCPSKAMSIWLLVIVDRKTGEVRTYHSWEIGRVHTVTPVVSTRRLRSLLSNCPTTGLSSCSTPLGGAWVAGQRTNVIKSLCSQVVTRPARSFWRQKSRSR